MAAVAMVRDPRTGELADMQFARNEEEAIEFYDSFHAQALLKVTIEVVSSVDGVIHAA